MKNYKSKKIFKIINNSNKYLNLHEIKRKTGAGNGYKSNIEASEELSSYNATIHKSHKINEVINEHGTDLNLHEIKAKTGAGSGHKHVSTTLQETKSSSHNNYLTSHKSQKIYDVVTKIEGRANLHKIKAQTGAGSGYKHDINTNTINEHISEDNIHKSHVIHAIFHNNDRKLNLHEIKRKTGAGNGYKR